MISNIVFTRNRPLQLEAYLQSLYRHMPKEQIQTYILYKVDLFDEQYSELFEQFSDCIVIREKNFHDDFMSLFERIDTKYILFGTDDVVYYDSVDFAVVDKIYDKFPEDVFGFSLRLDPTSLSIESEQISEMEINGQNIRKVNWKKAKSRNAKYPFELNSTVYTTALVKEILCYVGRERPLLKKIFPKESLCVNFLRHILPMKNFLASLETFHDPNTLEGYCYRWCKMHKSRFPSYLYFQKPCASAVQVNRVNTSIDNPVNGSNEHTVEVLNEKYKQGYSLDIDFLRSHKPVTTHVGSNYFRLKPHHQRIEQME